MGLVIWRCFAGGARGGRAGMSFSDWWGGLQSTRVALYAVKAYIYGHETEGGRGWYMCGWEPGEFIEVRYIHDINRAGLPFK